MRKPALKAFQFSTICALSVVSLASKALGNPDSREEAREVFNSAIADFAAIYRQVEGVSSTISLDYDVMDRLVLQAPAPDFLKDANGHSALDLQIHWNAELLWDRESGNSVASVARTSHVLNSIEQIRGPKSAIYYSMDGLVRSSFDAVPDYQPSPAEDVGRVRDFLSIASIDDQRYDNVLTQIRDWYLVPGGLANSYAVTTEGAETTVIIDWNGAENRTHTQNTYTFRRTAVGSVLTEFVQTSEYGVKFHRDTFQYTDVDPSPSREILLPTQRVSEIRTERGADGSASSTETIRVTRVDLHPGGYSKEALREEVSMLYGVGAANTMDELLRSAPTRREKDATIHPAQ